VQIPHCRAACSMNLRWSGCSSLPLAMPSIVSMVRPCASAPSTRQEHTTRPSIIVLQAPQSPVPQPSLAPISPRRLRRTSNRVSFGWHRNSTSSSLIVVETAIEDIIFLLRECKRSVLRDAPTHQLPVFETRPCRVCRQLACWQLNRLQPAPQWLCLQACCRSTFSLQH